MVYVYSIALILRDGDVTARSRYQTNTVQVHDFMKTVWPQAYSRALAPLVGKL